MNELPRIRTVVLLSGGLDSAVNLKRAHDETQVSLALTFDYGQRAALREIAASQSMCRKLGIVHRIQELPWLAEITQTALVDTSKPLPSPDPETMDVPGIQAGNAAAVWVPNRNGAFVAIGAAFAESLGAHAVVGGFNAEEGTAFPDNSPEFISAMNRLLSLSTLKKIKLLSYTTACRKDEIVRLGRKIEAPLADVWSCYGPGPEPCRACESCRRLERALKKADAWDWFKEVRERGEGGE